MLSFCHVFGVSRGVEGLLDQQILILLHDKENCIGVFVFDKNLGFK